SDSCRLDTACGLRLAAYGCEALAAYGCEALAAYGLGLHCGLTSFKAMNDLIAELLAHDRVRAARHHIERTDEVTLARQAALSAVPAPTGAEGQRAARVAELFRELGLRDVGVDEVGNVVGWAGGGAADVGAQRAAPLPEIGRASCRERGWRWVGGG